MEKTIRIIAAFTVIAVAAGGCLWGIDLAFGAVPMLTEAGLAVSLLALGLLIALFALYRRNVQTLKEQQAQELASQQRTHKEAMEKAAAQNRAEMDRFRSGLAHTLRMPVSIIQGYADLLISGVVTEDAVRDEYLRKISDRSQYMTEAISRQFSSGETLDASKLNYSDLDLLALVHQAAADMQTAAANQGVTIQVVSSDTAISMQADGYLLNRVLFNLLENSLKYMGRPGVITIWAMTEGEQVTIRVQDDGMGLSEEETHHIFEANFQGSNHTQGQGYGLFLVKQAVESHGGTISAQSALGRGMGITMQLPTKRA